MQPTAQSNRRRRSAGDAPRHADAFGGAKGIDLTGGELGRASGWNPSGKQLKRTLGHLPGCLRRLPALKLEGRNPRQIGATTYSSLSVPLIFQPPSDRESR